MFEKTGYETHLRKKTHTKSAQQEEICSSLQSSSMLLGIGVEVD